MIVNCPHCAKTVQAEAAGFYRCPYCQQIFEVQSPDAAPPDVATEATPPPSSDETAPADTAVSPAPESVGPEPLCERCHARPAQGLCRQCGQFVCSLCAPADESGQPVCLAHREAAPPPVEPTPLEMFTGLLSKPVRTMERLDPASQKLGAPLLYAVSFAMFGILCSTLQQWWLQKSLMNWLMPLFNTSMPDLDLTSSNWELALTVLISPFSAVVGVLFQALFMHFGLWMIRAGKSGLNATLKVVCYAQTGYVLSLIPIVGIFAASLYNLVLIIIGCAKIHRETYGRAILAYLLPSAICCCLAFAFLLIIFFLVGTVAGLGGLFGSTGGSPV